MNYLWTFSLLNVSDRIKIYLSFCLFFCFLLSNSTCVIFARQHTILSPLQKATKNNKGIGHFEYTLGESVTLWWLPSGIGAFKQSVWIHDSAITLSCYSFSGNLRGWRRSLNCILYLGGICFVSRLRCPEPLRREQLFHFFILQVLMWNELEKKI